MRIHPPCGALILHVSVLPRGPPSVLGNDPDPYYTPTTVHSSWFGSRSAKLSQGLESKPKLIDAGSPIRSFGHPTSAVFCPFGTFHGHTGSIPPRTMASLHIGPLLAFSSCSLRSHEASQASPRGNLLYRRAPRFINLLTLPSKARYAAWQLAGARTMFRGQFNVGPKITIRGDALKRQ